MKTVYQFKAGAHISGDAQAVGERLDQIRSKANGLTPESVVADAAQPSSVLHPHFEWDDSKAAERYRLDQAGHLIRSVTVVFEEPEASAPPRTVRAFLPVETGTGERVYESSVRAMNDGEMRAQVLKRAHAELSAVSRKWRELQELAGVFEALDQVALQLQPKEGITA
ncbi:hypothetical protein [Acidovorax sp. NCPPB 3576]|uniref:hypothetical protein n=1 Tax=Acidovorax sp. NCPPB 3576 TaxID=2940488 RepID=UPI00234BD3DD|nr:hypothetical protein [Acidovorax sp. NCPPB 3576]WCM88820.1 hypothetical protein M5C98_01835 [Acidovorax sp. NCPPB 3576]